MNNLFYNINMELKVLTQNEINLAIKDEIASLLRRKPNAVLGLATGSSPVGVYDELINLFKGYCGEVKSTAAPSTVLIEAEDPNMIDFINLVDRKGRSYQRFISADEDDADDFADDNDTPDTNFADVAYLMSGSDGNIDIDNYTIGVGQTYTTKSAAEEAIKSGALEVFDTSTFTVGGKELTSSLVDMDADFTPDEGYDAIVDGAYKESYFKSAPAFAERIDGITLVNEEY